MHKNQKPDENTQDLAEKKPEVAHKNKGGSKEQEITLSVQLEGKSSTDKVKRTISGKKDEILIDVLKRFIKPFPECYPLVQPVNLEAIINPHIPIGSLSAEEEIRIGKTKITLSKEDERWEGSDGMFIILDTFGKIDGRNKLICDEGYCPIYNKLGVFGYKEQTIKSAIRADGRINLKPGSKFCLVGKTNTQEYDSSLSLECLKDDIYTMEVSKTEESSTEGEAGDGNIKQESQTETNEPSTSQYINHPDNETGPTNETRGSQEETQSSTSSVSLTIGAENVTVYLVPEYKDLCQQFKKLQVSNKLKENHINVIDKHITLPSTQRIPPKHLNSVGKITVRHGQNTSTGTCFLLTGSIVVTCYHMVKSYSNKAQSPDISNADISFNYEGDGSKAVNYQVTKILALDKDHDFIILKLDRPVPDTQGLWQYLAFPPEEGAVSIIGYPDGRVKQSDLCSVIKFEERESEIKNHPLYVHVTTKYSFREIKGKDTLTYDTCFYYGSSGSPVFNDQGRLVAMHRGGYFAKGLKKRKSIIEYGIVITEIINKAIEIEEIKSALKESIRGNEELKNGLMELQKESLLLQPLIRRILLLCEPEKSQQAMEM